MLFTIGSTFLYFEQSSIVGATFADRTARTVVLARVELVVQLLTVVTEIFFTGRIIRWLGLVSALAFLPVVSMLGFGALASVPVFAALAAFVVLRRAGNFALTNPGMEVLFTVVPREDKYKAKSFIETFVYRGGDQVGAWTFRGTHGARAGAVRHQLGGGADVRGVARARDLAQPETGGARSSGRAVRWSSRRLTGPEYSSVRALRLKRMGGGKDFGRG